ncbi:MAG TPA: hypothetical protein DCZ94_09825 [Lentisphaeria bacterium]|nr:MAG: hypothetical protein A2X48_19065 [Lentisphaerae bacterium GWF2_49_21]HBC87241.1 hypothetical protein [Lentisphaeria bacterium]
MNIISISQNVSRLEFALFDKIGGAPLAEGELKNWMNQEIFKSIPEKITLLCGKTLRMKNRAFSADLICIRAPYGGEDFKSPELLTDKSIKKLRKIEHVAPMHIPALIELINLLKDYFRGTPISLVFETSFFTRLPEREYVYAVDPGLAGGIPLRRFGYHGIFHERAFEFSHDKDKGRSRVISICLEPIPEICAVKNGNPLMVTGGATPLEGLPGETTCGDIDPLIILSLSESLGWGPEEINKTLSRKSGIQGLTGKKMNFAGLFSSSDSNAVLAKNLFLYKILLATGSAIAAMGGVDAIVFSGRYHDLGKEIHTYLLSKLDLPVDNCEVLPDNLLRLTAEAGLLSLLKNK